MSGSLDIRKTSKAVLAPDPLRHIERNLVGRAVERRADARGGAVGGCGRGEAPGLDAVASGGGKGSVIGDHDLASRRVVAELLQLAADGEAGIERGLAGAEHD